MASGPAPVVRRRLRDTVNDSPASTHPNPQAPAQSGDYHADHSSADIAATPAHPVHSHHETSAGSTRPLASADAEEQHSSSPLPLATTLPDLTFGLIPIRSIKQEPGDADDARGQVTQIPFRPRPPLVACQRYGTTLLTGACRIPAFVKLLLISIVTHRAAILASIEHGLSNGRVESMNTKIRLMTRIAFGFASPDALIALAMLSLGGHKPALPDRI